MGSPEDRLRLVREVHAALGGSAVATPDAGPSAAPAGGTVHLEQGTASDDVGLLQVLAQRRSSYGYLASPLPRHAVSILLGRALGEQRRVRAYGSDDHLLAMSPSAGGLPSLDVYVCITRVEGVDPGIYRYRRATHDLELIVVGDPAPALRQVYLQAEFADRAALTICLVARLDVVLTKYSARHYRTVHVDAGVAVQNLYLVATALDGVGGCAVAGFDDAAADALLGLTDSAFTAVLFAVGSVRQG